MIAKAKSISHGINDIRYITGESRNKKHPELIFHVKDNLMQPGLDAAGLWESMQLTLAGSKKVRNSVIRIEVSPAPEHTKDFTTADWEKLWDDFAREFDSIELTGKDGKVYLIINNSETQATTVELPGPATVYSLNGKNGDKRATVMTLNGRDLVLGENWELPDLSGEEVSGGKLELAPMSCTFLVV